MQTEVAKSYKTVLAWDPVKLGWNIDANETVVFQTNLGSLRGAIFE